MFGLGFWEIGLLLLLGGLFGFRRLPRRARELGRLYGAMERLKRRVSHWRSFIR